MTKTLAERSAMVAHHLNEYTENASKRRFLMVIAPEMAQLITDQQKRIEELEIEVLIRDSAIAILKGLNTDATEIEI